MKGGSTRPTASLGTFFGVYLPCLLTILCVILYLRLGWISGHLGLWQTWLLITLANSITFLTGLSVAAISTNMKVGGGGSYYMVSRSLGLEVGAAIGIPLFLGKALGVSFYVVGFAESLRAYFPDWSLAQLGSICLISLLILALISTNIAAKIQLVVFGMITASLIGLAMGGPVPAPAVAPAASEPISFWFAFAIFFPAVTGIEAGVGLSGDLKDTKRALPLGTLSAIVSAYLVYMSVAALMLYWVPVELLRGDLLVMQDVMPHRSLFYIGLWGAALSSALISLLAAPRTLQKLARDGVAFRFLGQGAARDDTPRVATILTFLLALGGIWIGGLNEIAKALSMFFLTTYGLLNFAAAMEALLDNPSWRPSFPVKWWLSMTGALASFTVMFFLNAWASLAAIVIGFGIALWTHKRHLHRRWEDIRMGLWQFLTRNLLYRLKDYQPDIRSWRPNLLVFIGAPTKRGYLVELAHALSQNKGILTLAALTPAEEPEEQALLLETSIRQFVEKRKITALVRIHRTRNLLLGMRHMMHYYGMGPIQPNTVLLGQSVDFAHQSDFADLLLEVCRSKRNLILAKEHLLKNEDRRAKARRIDLWWSGHKRNLGFMLANAYLMQQSHAWAGAEIRILSIVAHEEERAAFLENLKRLIAEGRIRARADVLIKPANQGPFDLIAEYSRQADVVLTGMRAPNPKESKESYGQYYRALMEKLPQIPLVVQVLAVEDLPFFDLFQR